ncbi:MarR family winged helix-turn-helix transcriptional regulator [Belnapia rosea]|jgi:MarR family transcriptional regulator, lower aerobic nicotinate degradation pathway regulator|nr:MarR family transcriptional regulator [Belnapia rosea]
MPKDQPAAASLLLDRPGVLVRRLHQIHSAMFQEECGAFGVTPVQYSLLTLVAAAPGMDQGSAASGLRLDRFTTADVIKRLQAAGLLQVGPGRDRRTRLLTLTERGGEVYAAMQESAARAHERLVAPLPPRQRALLMRMLRRLVDETDPLEAPPPRVR